MARVLIVGGGRRALDLVRELDAAGHAVRMTTRTEARRAEIEAAGAECLIADPDRVGTLRYALDNVTVLMWLLGTVDDLDLHTDRWHMMLERTIDTTTRLVIYEAGPPEGVAVTEEMVGKNMIPFSIIRADAEDWLGEARAALSLLL